MLHVGRRMERNGGGCYATGRGRPRSCLERREELREEPELQEKGRNGPEDALSFLILRRWEV